MASFTQTRNLCAVAAAAVLIAGGCGKHQDTASNGSDGDLSNLQTPDAHMLRVNTPAPQPDFVAVDPSSAVSETPRVVEKFKSPDELFAELKKQCSEAGLTVPTMITGDSNKVVVVNLSKHSDGNADDAGVDPRISKTKYLNECWGLSAVFCEGYLGKGSNSPEQQRIIAERDKILAIGARNGGDALVSVPDAFPDSIPKGVQMWGVESEKSMRLTTIANIVAEGWVQVEKAAAFIQDGGTNVAVGTMSAPSPVLLEMLAAQDALKKFLKPDELPPLLSLADLRPDANSEQLAVNAINAKSIALKSSSYAQWHLKHLVEQRNNDLHGAIATVLPELGSNVHAFFDVGALHGVDRSTNNPVINAFTDRGYTVIITE